MKRQVCSTTRCKNYIAGYCKLTRIEIGAFNDCLNCCIDLTGKTNNTKEVKDEKTNE